jgi:hypothetical protein
VSGDWTFSIRDAPHISGGVYRGDLIAADDRSLTMDKDQPGEASFSIPFANADGTIFADAQLIKPRTRDLIIYRDATLMFRGRLVDYTHSYDPDGLRVQLKAADYRGLLARRYLYSGPAGTDCPTTSGESGELVRKYGTGGTTGLTTKTDVADIAWDLINMAQGATPISGTQRPAGAALGITKGLGFTAGAGSTGVSRNGIEFSPGTSILDCLNQLFAGDDGTSATFAAGTTPTPGSTEGCEWEISPTLALNIWPMGAGGRGSAAGPLWVADYGGTVAGGTVDASTAAYANRVNVATSQDGLSSRLLDAGSTVLADQGLWEQAVSADGTTQQAVDVYAARQLRDFSTYTAGYDLQLTPGAWDQDTALGDSVKVLMSTIEGLSSDVVRVNAQTFSLDRDGIETVSLSLGAVPWFTARAIVLRAARTTARIARLERTLFTK